MKSRATTLLALLAANEKLGQSEVYRTVLVKQAFLAETIRPLYQQWRQVFEFVRYYYGPYSDDIFFRLDTLIFHGLVEVVFELRQGNRKQARYRITAAGQQVLGNLEATEIKELAHDLIWALQTLGVHQAKDICMLVYQEAEFSRIFTKHSESAIGPETKVALPSVTSVGNKTFEVMLIIQRLVNQRDRLDHSVDNLQQLPSREIVRIYLSKLYEDMLRKQNRATV